MHLVFCVTSHGYGHLSQSAPIVAALRARLPGLRVTVRTGLPEPLVRERMGADVAVIPNDTDFGFEMRDALTVDDDASLARYAALHADAGRWRDAERSLLTGLRADLVFANIGYAPIEAAASLGIPAFGACSLNWASLLEQRYPGRPDVRPIAASIRAAYGRATALFELAPGMPFDGFDNVVPIEPIGRLGAARRDELLRRLGLAQATRLLLVAFGGTPMPLRTGDWRLPEGWAALVFADAVDESERVRSAESIGWSFVDLLASCDVVVAKPGYGTFTEAGFAGRDTLVVPREGWPESAYLVDWLSRHARCASLPADRLRAGDFDAALAELAAQPPRPPARGDGAARIAEAVATRLGIDPPWDNAR
jgi:hypothetical protein